MRGRKKQHGGKMVVGTGEAKLVREVRRVASNGVGGDIRKPSGDLECFKP